MFRNRRLYANFTTLCLILIFVVLLFVGCTPSKIKIGQYKCGDAVIEIKHNNKVSFKNVDFTELQKYYDENGIDIDLSERTQGDIPFEIGSDETRIYVVIDESFTINMRYDNVKFTIVLLNQTYVFSN